MAQLRDHLTRFSEDAGSERLELVAVLRMTGIRAHAGIKPHEFDAEFVVPPNCFYNVTNIC